ncbi:hypothetical protein QLT00_gp83 [Gordonia phage Commandaria]|uniref:Uncharacterized protein n=1 Tax=Gordonia phage Commandaria TaxID=3038364 RepID=A0AAF0GGD5_9CAUD|nr:hypothetical protein QLT00_gp83 [Gordonia phage Commandaria]WGH20866.1 hypothetical protein [Gordonia phage Commandaria]
MAHTLTPAQRDRMAALGTGDGDWTVTRTVRSAHVLAAAVANDDFHGALDNVIRGAGARMFENLDVIRADDVERFAAHVAGGRYGTDDADRARIAGELFAIADYMRTYDEADDAPRSYWYRFNHDGRLGVGRVPEQHHYVGDLDGLAHHVARLLTVRTVRLLDDGRMVDAGCGMTVGTYGEL